MTAPGCSGGDSPRQAPARLIALGASNLARGLLTLTDVVRAATGGPIEVVAALGRGRSYGLRSSLLGRTLVGIDDCGLWRALPSLPPRRTRALLLDVGNDILYGIDAATILRWVDGAVQRLCDHGAACVVAGLPLASIDRLGPRRYRLVRSVLVPGCRLSLAEVQDRAHRVEAGLRDLALRRGCTFRPLRAEWYGFDPVHIRRSHAFAAFADLLGLDVAPPRPALDGAAARLRLLQARPERRWWFGREQHAAQPARRFADGTTLSLY